MVRMRLVGARRNRINPCNIHDVEVLEKEAEKDGKVKKAQHLTRNRLNTFMYRQMMKFKVISSKRCLPFSVFLGLYRAKINICNFQLRKYLKYINEIMRYY